MGQFDFARSGAQFMWGLFNLVLLIGVIALPIWFIRKINSIDQSLKELLRKTDKNG